jgi:hypothetical protein
VDYAIPERLDVENEEKMWALLKGRLDVKEEGYIVLDSAPIAVSIEGIYLSPLAPKDKSIPPLGKPAV